MAIKPGFINDLFINSSFQKNTKKTSYRSLSYENFVKDKMTRMVNILWIIFEKIALE